jgi:hypothetical protein
MLNIPGMNYQLRCPLAIVTFGDGAATIELDYVTQAHKSGTRVNLEGDTCRVVSIANQMDIVAYKEV